MKKSKMGNYCKVGVKKIEKINYIKKGNCRKQPKKILFLKSSPCFKKLKKQPCHELYNRKVSQKI